MVWIKLNIVFLPLISFIVADINTGDRIREYENTPLALPSSLPPICEFRIYGNYYGKKWHINCINWIIQVNNVIC